MCLIVNEHLASKVYIIQSITTNESLVLALEYAALIWEIELELLSKALRAHCIVLETQGDVIF